MRRKQRNYLIAGLCMVLVVMTVGYAVFSQQLKINGTSQITSNWCLGFDSDNTSTYTVTNGGGTAPTGSISFSGTACESKYVPGATISASFTTPGDSIEYTLTIKNAGTVDAAIKSIMVGEESLTSDTTKQLGNILFTIKMPEATSISADSSTTMKVIAAFQDEENITGRYTGENQSIEIKINAAQDDGTGGFVMTAPAYSGTIYRRSSDYLAISGSDADDGESSSISGLTEGVDYTKSAEALKIINSKAVNYYLKHTIVNDKITESYVCFVTNKEYCLQGGDGGAAYKYEVLGESGGIWAVLNSQESWFKSQEFEEGEDGKGYCSFGDSRSNCYGGVFDYVGAYSYGYVYVDGTDDGYCRVNDDGGSKCHG